MKQNLPQKFGSFTENPYNTYRLQYVIMVANIEDLEGVDNYAAMILRKDNPHFVDYVSEFNNTVNMFMLKPEH